MSPLDSARPALDLAQRFRSARRVSTPLIAIRTADQQAAIALLRASLNGSAPPLLAWDLVRGLQGLNEDGRTTIASLGIDPITTGNPVEALTAALQLPASCVLFMYNAQRVIANEAVSQALCNLRDEFKANARTLVLLCPDITLPPELSSDVLVLDDPLPSEAQLATLIEAQCTAASLPAPDADTLRVAVSATSGLAAFPAEQVIAESLRKSGIDVVGLWERKRQAIEQVPGLSVYRGRETFDDIGGCANAITFGRSVLNGELRPYGVVFIDEIDKQMAGTQGDTSGVSQENHGTLLTWMQEKRATGMLLVGPPGAAKSLYAKALGNTGNLPCIQFDMSAMKASLVGESGRNLRAALKVVDAVTQGRVLFVATCNSMATLSPELRRRFSFGTFYFDLPTSDERAVIWQLYLKQFAIATQPMPNDNGWTGAEIRACCDLAYRLKSTLVSAASFIVPVARSAAESIARLREQAHGRYISAARPGVYEYDRSAVAASSPSRAIAALDE